MIGFDDERWNGLNGGYRTPFDPRPALRVLESGKASEAAWRELWKELHHQGDVGEASYAAVPHIVRIHRQFGVPGWNPYAIVGIIDLARDGIRNPKLPEWLERDYFGSLHDLARCGAVELPLANDPDQIRAILAILAISKGARTYGRLLLNYTEKELQDFETQAMG